MRTFSQPTRSDRCRRVMDLCLGIGCVAAAAALIVLMICTGCQSAAYEQGDANGQGLNASYTVPPTPPMLVITRTDGSVESVVGGAKVPKGPQVAKVDIIAGSPGSVSSYVVKASRSDGDHIIASRVMTWAGASPGEVVKAAACQPHMAVANPLPEVNIDAQGVHAKAGGGSSETNAGLPWYTRLWDWIVSVFRSLTMTLAFFVLLPLVVLFVLPLLWPAAGPICQKILHAVGHVLTFGLSSVVTLWRRLTAARQEAATASAATSTSSGSTATATTATEGTEAAKDAGLASAAIGGKAI